MEKWVVVCGRYFGIEKNAVDKMCGILTNYLDYPVVVYEAVNCTDEVINSKNIIMMGVGDGNKYCVHEGIKEEEYCIEVLDSPFNTENQIIKVTGSDESGLLYGVADFENVYLPFAEYSKSHVRPYYLNRLFYDKMKEYKCISSPDIKRRGLWSWGFVVYDYKKYIDNMVKAKLNMLVLWNDDVPVNAREIVEYAHINGVKILWGYQWGWDVKIDEELLLNTVNHPEKIVDEYIKSYAPLGADGIYFQTFTEITEEKIGEYIVAEKAAELVNKVSSMLFKYDENILIQFGLHATSVKDKLDFIKNVDARIEIVWEDCGAFPFDYIPDKIEGYEETKEFVGRINRLRGENDRFGVVLKGLICLDWDTFKHERGPLVIGKAGRDFIKKRLEEKKKVWKYVNATWLGKAGYAYDMIKKIKKDKNGDTTILALVEDGMFEEKPWFAVMLYAAMLWNTNSEISDMMEKTARSTDDMF